MVTLVEPLASAFTQRRVVGRVGKYEAEDCLKGTNKSSQGDERGLGETSGRRGGGKLCIQARNYSPEPTEKLLHLCQGLDYRRYRLLSARGGDVEVT